MCKIVSVVVGFFSGLRCGLSLSRSRVGSVVEDHSGYNSDVGKGRFSCSMGFASGNFGVGFMRSMGFNKVCDLDPVFSNGVRRSYKCSSLAVEVFPGPVVTINLTVFLCFFLVNVRFVSITKVLKFPAVVMTVLALFLYMVVGVAGARFGGVGDVLSRLFHCCRV